MTKMQIFLRAPEKKAHKKHGNWEGMAWSKRAASRHVELADEEKKVQRLMSVGLIV